MFAYGLSGPPRIQQGGSILLNDNTTQALPALPNGAPWGYALVSTSSLTTAYFSYGDSTVDAATLSTLQINVSCPIVMNLSGFTHVDRHNNDVVVTAIDAPRGSGNMLASPPQLCDADSINQSTTSAGTANLPTLTSGAPVKYIMLTCDTANSLSVAVGDSTVDATTSPQFFLHRSTSPVILNVTGMTDFSWSAISGGFLMVTPLAT